MLIADFLYVVLYHECQTRNAVLPSRGWKDGSSHTKVSASLCTTGPAARRTEPLDIKGVFKKVNFSDGINSNTLVKWMSHEFGLMMGWSSASFERSFNSPDPWFPTKATAVERYFSGALTVGSGDCYHACVSKSTELKIGQILLIVLELSAVHHSDVIFF